jgi:probable F420-dependent oxidoreductase
LGCYVLPGGVRDPRQAIQEAQAAEALGLGAVWIGERYDTKDLPALAGAISQVTRRVRICAGVTHPGLRHPMVLASMGQTLQALSDGRFVLGLGRSAPWRWEAYGVPAPTNAGLTDTAGILRRLWAGESVTYDGPAGSFPELRLPQRPAAPPPPLLLAAIGPKTLAVAGRSYDGVVLHPCLTPQAVTRSIATVRAAAQAAGRDPGSVRCCATVLVAPDRDALEAGQTVAARAAGYLQVAGLGDAIVAANDWDPTELARHRSQPSQTLPADWLPSSSAVGTAAACATRLHEYLAAGADELVLHGTTAEHLGGLVEAFESVAA